MGEKTSAVWIRRSVILTAVAYCFFFGALGFILGPFDFDHISAYYEIAWRFWRHEGGLPEFNPFLCGGRTLGADPQTPLYSPFVLLVPVLGPVWTVKLQMLLFLGAGLYGLKLCSEHFTLAALNRLWGYFLFLTSGAIVARFLVGHVAMSFLFVLPLFLGLSYRVSTFSSLKGKWRWILGYGFLFIAAASYQPNFLIVAAPLLLIEHAVRAFIVKKPRLFVLFLIGLCLAVAANAPTYLPAGMYFSSFPRGRPYYFDWIPPYALFANLLIPFKAIPKAWFGQSLAGNHEYSVFLGPLGVFFAWLGWRNRKAQFSAERAGLLALIVAGALLGFGTSADSNSLWYPYNWLRATWPGFESLRVPQRLWIGVFLGGLLFSMIGFRAPKKRWQFAGLVVFSLFPGLVSAVTNLSKTALRAKGTQWTWASEYRSDFEWVTGDPDDTYRFVRQGRGVRDCLYNIEVGPAPLKDGRLLTPLASQAGAIHAHWLGWSEFIVNASMKSAPFEVAFNINHSPYWKWEGEGGRVSSKLKQPLTVKSDTATLTGKFRFEQPYVRVAVLVSIAAWLAFGSVIFVLARRR